MDGLDRGNHELAELVHIGGFNPHDHVVRPGHVLRLDDTSNVGDSLRNLRCATDFGLDEDVGLNHANPFEHARSTAIAPADDAIATDRRRRAVAKPADPAALGEFGLIARVVRRLGAPPPPLGPGDDAAVVPAPDGRLVATTDLLAEGVHFRRDWSSGYDIGRRAAAANLADVAAMGATATAVLVGLAIPGGTDTSWLDELTDGLRDECALVGAQVVGGDTIGSSDRITLAITALGDLAGRAPVMRSGASVGDVVVLVGRTGWAGAGLALLQAPNASAAVAHPELVDAFRRPNPPYSAGPALAEVGATSMCDVSDGLLADAGHLAEASGVRIDLDSAAVRQPALDGAGQTLGERSDWELTGGDDHALVATVPVGTELVGVLADARVIGRVLPGEGVTVDGAPIDRRLVPGHDHFAGSR